MPELEFGDYGARLVYVTDLDELDTELVLPVEVGGDPFADLPPIIRLPDMAIDLTAYRIKIGDAIEYIQKHRGWQEKLEAWSLKLTIFADAIRLYLQEAREVPDEVRQSLNDFLVATESARNQAVESAQQAALSAQAAQEAASSAAGGYMPTITVADAGKVLTVNAAGDGYVLTVPQNIEYITELV